MLACRAYKVISFYSHGPSCDIHVLGQVKGVVLKRPAAAAGLALCDEGAPEPAALVVPELVRFSNPLVSVERSRCQVGRCINLQSRSSSLWSSLSL